MSSPVIDAITHALLEEGQKNPDGTVKWACPICGWKTLFAAANPRVWCSDGKEVWEPVDNVLEIETVYCIKCDWTVEI